MTGAGAAFWTRSADGRWRPHGAPRGPRWLTEVRITGSWSRRQRLSGAATPGHSRMCKVGWTGSVVATTSA